MADRRSPQATSGDPISGSSGPSPPALRLYPPPDDDPGKKGARSCGQIFAPPRTYSPPPVITGDDGEELIQLTAAESRRLFNLHTAVSRTTPHHEHWSRWRRRHQAATHGFRYARRTGNNRLLL
jgi:hypothetical protein